MYYVLRPGVVKTKICGVFLLIPDRKASEICPRIQRLNLITALTLEVLEKREPIENAYRNYTYLSRKTMDEAKEKIDGILDDLCKKGYLICEENEP